jgi:hypothetical protein
MVELFGVKVIWDPTDFAKLVTRMAINLFFVFCVVSHSFCVHPAS